MPKEPMTSPSVEIVAEFPDQMPTGVTVTPNGRTFLCFPRWFDKVRFTVGELMDDGTVAPYPNDEINCQSRRSPMDHFLSVQSVIATDAKTLWVLDTGRPAFLPAVSGAMKLVEIDLDRDEIRRVYEVPYGIARTGTYLNDVRFDFQRGAAGTAFITDSATLTPSAIIVIDLATGEKLRRLDGHPSTQPRQPAPVIEGHALRIRSPLGLQFPYNGGADGIAMSPDRSLLYFCPLIGTHLHSVDAGLLADRAATDETVAESVCDLGEKGFSDGLECDALGRVYATDLEHNAIRRRENGGWSTIAMDDRMLWPDTMSIAGDGYIYYTANQIHRMAIFNAGKDLRKRPYHLFRTHIGAGPA